MITGNSNPRIKQVARWQTSAGERQEAGIFLVEGFKMYAEAPEESLLEVYVTPEALERSASLPQVCGKLARTGYETVSSGVFRKMSDTLTPQGILCVVKRPSYCLEQLLEAPAPLLVVLEHLQDPGNLGTIVRTGEGAGVTGIILGGRTVDIYNPKTIRATMGSVYRVPFVYADDLCAAVGRMRERDICVYAAHLAGQAYYDSFSFQGGTAFLIGNEGSGLSQELTEQADCSLRIPMAGQVESLNAAVSAALLMYEASRQRLERKA